jgi:endonuclease G
MKVWARVLIGVGWVCLLGTFAQADYLEVRKDTAIKAVPQKDGAVVFKAVSGSYLTLEDQGQQKNGYYHVKTVPQGQVGWVYRTLVRRFPGDAPGPAVRSEAEDPLRDPTQVLTAEQRSYASRHLRLGKPQAVYERVREGYVLAQDVRLKIPLWVQYDLSREDASGAEEREDKFRPDMSIPTGARAELNDYKGSGFDRGHMAPAADMKRSTLAMEDSFLLSNMAPQVGKGFNRGIWKDLEEAVRGWAQQRGTLTIITGPIFNPDGDHVSYRVIGRDRVAVPTHFFKIVVDTHDKDHLDALAFLLPNKDISGRNYREFLTSIREIEGKTGLDFLSALPSEVQNRLESNKADKVW